MCEYIMDTMDEENYSSHWEKCLKTGLFNKSEVIDLYRRHYIDFLEYKYALDYFNCHSQPMAENP